MANYMRPKRAKKARAPKKIKSSEFQSVWEARIGEAEAYKEDWKERFACDTLEAMYNGNQKPETWQGEWFTLNLMFSSAKILKRNICPRKLKILLRLARTFVSDPSMIEQLQALIRIREAVIQYTFDKEEVWREGQESYQNSLYQFGVLKTGYEADLISNENAGGVLEDREGNIIRDDEGIPMQEEEYSVDEETFFIDSVDPDCFLVDRYCRNNLDKTGSWCAQKIFMSLEDAKAEPLFRKSVVNNLSASSLEEGERILLQSNERFRAKWQWDAGAYLPENDIVVAYEIYDLRRNEILTLIRGAEDVVRGPDPMPPGIDKHPFTIIKFYEKKNSFYPIPVMYNWMGAQAEYNLTRNQIATHRKRFNRKYGYIDGMIDPEEIEKVTDGGDGTMVKFNQAGAIEAIKDAPLDQAVYFETRALKEDFMESSGVGEIQRNVASAESATEAEIVERRARESEVDEHEAMMGFMGDVAKDLHNSIEANITQEGAIETIGPAGVQWVSFGPENFQAIAGEVVFTAEVQADSKMTLQVERAQMLQLIDILGKNPFLALDDVILRAVTDKFPALANNELLIQRIRQMAVMQVQMMLGAQQQQGQGQGGQKKISQSTGGEASKSRKVATGK